VGQGDYLLARTPGEAELVKKYNALSLARHALPGFSFRQAALSWTVPLSAFEVPDPEVKRECDTVETSVLSQLTPYARTGG
jgi:hypothetical protein